MTSPRLDWQSIRTILLDMDGTLLDLHFDDYFWREHVPRRYGEVHGLETAAARKLLYDRYRTIQGSLEWYCVDFWSRELQLDIPVLKREVEHLIAVHPHVLDFLSWARRQRKRLVLVTNAHGKSLSLKMEKTRLGGNLDRLICAHDFGLPKEELQFWEELQKAEPFSRESTLLIEDNLQVLKTARAYGIGHLVAVRKPNTRLPEQKVGDFVSIRDFGELIPARSTDRPGVDNTGL